MSETIIIGFLGTTLDAGHGQKRWDRWRPTVALCQQDDLLVDRFELLYDRKFSSLLKTVVEDIGHVSPETEVVPTELNFKNAWEFEEVFGKLHDFAASYPFNPESNRYLLHITTGTHVGQICQFLLAEAHYFPAALIQTHPPPKRSPDTVGSYSIIDLDLSKYDQIASRFQARLDDDIAFLKSGIETRDKSFNELIEQIEHVAIRSREPMLYIGPTGAGKSQLAQRLYELKKERTQLDAPFVEVNCATLRGDAAMSTLFGHRKGAFTGAQTDREGLLRKADGGVLFLDEVGELGLDEQTMLLRAIEEKRFFPLGSDTEVTSDFQLVCGTNRNIAEMVAQGTFREDLFARINLWTFHLPGLKDRRADIEPNLDYELDRFARENGEQVGINKEARNAFLKFAKSSESSWSGNFRDLRGAVTRMATLAVSGRISKDVVAAECDRLQTQWSRTESVHASHVEDLLGSDAMIKLDRFDRSQLEDVLSVCREQPTLSAAGRVLFAQSRTTKRKANDADRLRKYLIRFGINWDQL